MKFLVVGLGSMGKRRIRCLKALGHTEVFGFDRRADRQNEAKTKYGIKTFENFNAAMEEIRPDALIVSVPPDAHHEYVKVAIQKKIHCFIEASVVDTDMEQMIADLRKTDLVAAPSATLMFHPAIEKIGEIVQSGVLGKVSNLLFHSGQYLPDWHTYEKVSEYYVSNPATGGAREIVPFELSWITRIFGYPQRVAGNVRKTIHIEGAEKIDDTYNFLLDYGQFLMTATVDVVSRHATRRLVINGEQKQLLWDWDAGCIKLFDPASSQWQEVRYEMQAAEQGYNANIGENMYIEEIRNFVDAIARKRPFINTVENDHRLLKLLYAIEASDRSGKFVELER